MPTTFVAHIRGLVLAVAVPLGVILAGFTVGAVAAHQMQVQGLWAPALIAPDPGRLWSPGRGSGLAPGLERIAWAVVKAVVLVGVSFWAIRAVGGITAAERAGRSRFWRARRGT